VLAGPNKTSPVGRILPATSKKSFLIIAIGFATRLTDSSLIPENEQNDGKILAQSSLAGIPLLVASDKHLLDIDEDALLLAFNDVDLVSVHPAHPKRLLRALRGHSGFGYRIYEGTEFQPVSNFEVPNPILSSPFDEPKEHWIVESRATVKATESLGNELLVANEKVK